MLGVHLCRLLMVKHTYDEFECIQSINYESPVLLAMHQLRRGKRSNTVPGVHGSRKGKLMQHTCGARTPCIVCGKWKIVKSEQSHLRLMINPCLAAFPWEGHGGRSCAFPLVTLSKRKKKSSIPRREYCSLIDYAEIFYSGNVIHRF